MNDSKNTPPNDESSLPTTPNAQSRAAYFEDMLPGVIASDERDGRLGQALKRRRGGIPLTSEEVRRDLKAVLTQLTVSFMQYEHSFSTFLRTPAHALDYAERVAAYAMKDYPREFEDDSDIAGLWDTLRTIHVLGYAWRKGENKTDGKQLVVIVNKIATDALERIYPVGETSDGTGARVGSSDPTAKMSKAEVMAELDKAAQNDAAAAMADTVLTQENMFKKSAGPAAHTSTADELVQADVAAQTDLANTLNDVATHIDQRTEGAADAIIDVPNQRTDQALPTPTTEESYTSSAENAIDPVNRVEASATPIDTESAITDLSAGKRDGETDGAAKNDDKTDKVARVDVVNQEDEDDKIDLSW